MLPITITIGVCRGKWVVKLKQYAIEQETPSFASTWSERLVLQAGSEQDNAEHLKHTRTISCRTSDRLSVGRPLFNQSAGELIAALTPCRLAIETLKHCKLHHEMCCLSGCLITTADRIFVRQALRLVAYPAFTAGLRVRESCGC